MEVNLNKYKKWLEFLKKVSSFFEGQGFLEVKTPSFVPSGAMEAQLDSYKIEEGVYLPTSPEFSLKKLWLNQLSDSLFEISSSFRAHEEGESHLSEFTMLEFYKASSDMDELELLLKEFVAFLIGEPLVWEEVELDCVFESFTGFELHPSSDRLFLQDVCRFHSLFFREDYSWNDLYQTIFIQLIEPLLGPGPLFLKNYPPQIAALAKINDRGWAERLEVYWKGLELANGYNELLDHKEIEKRWKAENLIREQEDKPPHPLDHDLIQCHAQTALSHGVGMALGLERLFWILNGSDELKVWPFRS